MSNEVMNHSVYMELMNRCMEGKMELSNDEIMQMQYECEIHNIREEYERLNIYTDYAMKSINEAYMKGLKIAEC